MGWAMMGFMNVGNELFSAKALRYFSLLDPHDVL